MWTLTLPRAIITQYTTAHNQHSSQQQQQQKGRRVNQRPELWKPQRRCHQTKMLRYTRWKTVAKQRGQASIKMTSGTSSQQLRGSAVCYGGPKMEGNTREQWWTNSNKGRRVIASLSMCWLSLALFTQQAFGDPGAGSRVAGAPAETRSFKKLSVLYRATACCGECVALRLT